jgi:hypothetical protein
MKIFGYLSQPRKFIVTMAVINGRQKRLELSGEHEYLYVKDEKVFYYNDMNGSRIRVFGISARTFTKIFREFWKMQDELSLAGKLNEYVWKRDNK